MTITIRPAVLLPPGQGDGDDGEMILALVQALAKTQDADGFVTATADDLRRDGSGPTARFRALVAEQADGRTVGPAPVGLALYYFTYSTWAGRPKLYVEDLFVDSALRGSGLGRRLLATLAREALSTGCKRLDLSVKTDNQARGFYGHLGLKPSGTWQPYFVDGSALKALAESA